MNFELTEEQKILQESVTRFIQDHYGDLVKRQEFSAEPNGFNKQNWEAMAELGWFGVPFSEEDGGLGGGYIENMLVMEQFGKGLVLEPYLASIIMGGGALRRSGNEALNQEVIPGVIEGTRQLAFAYAEKQARFDLHNIAATARAEGDTFVLNGQKSMVANAESASDIVVAVRTSGNQTDKSGISLFLVDAKADGVKLENFPTVDGLRASEMTLTDTKVDKSRLIGEVDQGFSILQAVANDAMLGLCAEAVGAMEVLYKDTVAYTQEREQFGHPLSDFQALQHRMVDMFVAYEQCKSLLYRANMEMETGSELAGRTIHALKHLVGKSSIAIGEEAVQMHGGMGMTEELRIGHYFKRLLVIDAQFGNADYHLQQFAA